MKQPDSPGWWAFEGSEIEDELILPEGYETWEEFENSWAYHRENFEREYRETLGEPFRTVVEVKWIHDGQAISTREHFGPHHGEPVLGFLSPKYRWSFALYGLDTVVGEWTRVNVPWEER